MSGTDAVKEERVDVKLFVKDECPRCPAAKQVCEGFERVEVFDVTSADGLAEASFYSVLSTPAVLVIDSDGAEVAGWRGEAPDRSTLTSILTS